MISTVDYITKQTQVYWHLSMARHGRTESNMRVNEALTACNSLMAILSPDRRVAKSIFHLQQSIIQGGQRKKPDEPAKLIPLRA